MAVFDGYYGTHGRALHAPTNVLLPISFLRISGTQALRRSRAGALFPHCSARNSVTWLQLGTESAAPGFWMASALAADAVRRHW